MTSGKPNRINAATPNISAPIAASDLSATCVVSVISSLSFCTYKAFLSEDFNTLILSIICCSESYIPSFRTMTLFIFFSDSFRQSTTIKNPAKAQTNNAIVIRQSKNAKRAAAIKIEIIPPNISGTTLENACSIVVTSFKSVEVKYDKSCLPKYDNGSFRSDSAREIRTFAASSYAPLYVLPYFNFSRINSTAINAAPAAATAHTFGA